MVDEPTQFIPNLVKPNVAGLSRRGAIDLAVDTIKVALLVGIEVHPNGQPARSARNDWIDVREVLVASSVVDNGFPSVPDRDRNGGRISHRCEHRFRRGKTRNLLRSRFGRGGAPRIGKWVFVPIGFSNRLGNIPQTHPVGWGSYRVTPAKYGETNLYDPLFKPMRPWHSPCRTFPRKRGVATSEIFF